MLSTRPIVIVEDDKDDQEMMQFILQDLKVIYPVKFFDFCEDAFHYLKTTNDSPFIIISDINLPKQGGLEFKHQIDHDSQLRQKSIPFVFYSTNANPKAIETAYSRLIIQGFFVKPSNYTDAKEIIKLVLEYWLHCRHPNSLK